MPSDNRWGQRYGYECVECSANILRNASNAHLTDNCPFCSYRLYSPKLVNAAVVSSRPHKLRDIRVFAQ